MKLTDETRQVPYHSRQWADLCEAGWVTWVVDSAGMATMIRQRVESTGAVCTFTPANPASAPLDSLLRRD